MQSSLARNVFLLIGAVSVLYLLAMAGMAHNHWLPESGWVRGGLYLTGPLVALLFVPKLLVGMFQHSYHLRYRVGNGRQALKEWRVWKLLLPAEHYELIRFTLLLEVGEAEAAAQILTNPKLPAWKIEHMRHALCLHKGEIEHAQEHLRRALEGAPPYELANCKLDLAIFLAQNDNGKLIEAFRLFDEAQRETVQPALKPLTMAQEALLFVVGGQPAAAHDILQKKLPVVERMGINTLPSVGYLNRWLAWSEASQGRPEEALERLKKFRELVKVPVYQKKFDEDIRRLEFGEALFPAVSDEITAFTAERARRRLPGSRI